MDAGYQSGKQLTWIVNSAVTDGAVQHNIFSHLSLPALHHYDQLPTPCTECVSHGVPLGPETSARLGETDSTANGRMLCCAHSSAYTTVVTKV